MNKVTCKNCGELVNLVDRTYYYQLKEYPIFGVKDGKLSLSTISKTRTLDERIDHEIVCPSCNTAYLHSEVIKMYADSDILYSKAIPILAAKPAVIKATITKAGQQEKRYGDRLKAIVRIDLPIEENQIIPGLNYGIRCYIFGQMLTNFWGHLDAENLTRYYTSEILGDTWEECQKIGEKVISSQLDPLLALIENRKKIWEEANEIKNS